MTVFNPELGTIPRKTIKIFKYRILNLSNPGQELSANKIHTHTKKNKTSHAKIKFISILLKSIDINQC